MVSAFTELKVSQSNYNVGATTELQVEATLLSPVPQTGLFRATVGMSDLILAMASTECRYAPNYSTDAFVAYAENKCSDSYYTFR